MIEAILKVNLMIAIIDLVCLLIMKVMKDLGKYNTPKCKEIKISNSMVYIMTTCLVFTPIINVFVLAVIIIMVFYKDSIE